MPTVWKQGDAQIVLVADTLIFASPSAVVHRSATHYLNVVGFSRDTTVLAEETLSYDINYSQITFSGRSCPPNANCIGPSTGFIDSHRIDVNPGVLSGAVLHYTPR